MKTKEEIRFEKRRKSILEVRKILPYLEKVNNDLFDLDASLRPDSSVESQYAYWVCEIKVQLDFIASALTDEKGNRFGGEFQDGFIVELKDLYTDSLMIQTKTIQEKIMLNLLIKVCDAVLIANGSGESNSFRHINADYALGNTRKFINLLLDEYEYNNYSLEKHIWFDLKQPNFINSDF